MLDAKRVERIFARRTHGIKPGLGSITELLKRLGNPQSQLAAIHAAGTNGKGSVCAMLNAALATTGLPVGLYTSPHLIRLNERFTISGKPIGDAELDSLLAEVEAAAERMESESSFVATFFECVTAAAFLYFQRNGVKLAVVETGMGGRLDATNVLTPMLSVITRIAVDHGEFLGADIAGIAGEKAGIIKPGRPVVAGAMPEEALAVVAEAARKLGAPLIDAAATISARRVSGDLENQKVAISGAERDYGTLSCALAASYQVENIATVVAAIEALSSHVGLELPANAVKSALENVRWPGRFQLIGKQPPVLVDGAHNPDGAKALARALKDAGAGRQVGLVCGFCADKDIEGFFRTMAPVAKRAWTVPIRNPRSTTPGDVARTASGYRLQAEAVTDLPGALERARLWASDNRGVVVICGSLFLVGEALQAAGKAE